ncbi:hypothetical protein SAMN04515647_4082 [Cohaesibacter sp. ES.047]|uniref:hypothetical protein n=1 Tax=Cohaesibacter sp. ES.047 TaxID=1798205 RepID=UPI000BC01F46|nr:hypothetical protein [Cohaesibacter sp. ES.047]SNY93762.1 hypothetical protein SAMN04515647_4082 [Cohaesibacter sp. ES.047]
MGNFSQNKSGCTPQLDTIEIDRQKQEALGLLDEIWDQACDDGLNLDCLAHAALFQALSSLVLVYGEESVARMVSKLPERLRCGDYTLGRNLQ